MLSFKQFKQFIDEDYKTTAVKFVASGIDKAQVDVYINKFKELSNKQKLAGDEKNIDFWSKKAFSEFSDFVDKKEKEVADVAKKKAEKKDPGESIDITSPQQRSAGWKIIIPLDKAASVFYGNLDCMADWCVAKREHDYFNKYFYSSGITLIFCLNDKKEKWAIAIPTSAGDMDDLLNFFDKKNNYITEYEFEMQTKLKFADIVRNYKPVVKQIEKIRESSPEKLFIKFTRPGRLPITEREYNDDILLHKTLQEFLLTNSMSVDTKIENIFKYQLLLPDGIIFKDGVDFMLSHIDNLIVNILDDETTAIRTIKFIKPYILSTQYKKIVESKLVKLNDIAYIISYIQDISQEPFPEAEPLIAQYGFAAFYYATEILKSRFPAGERMINRTSYYKDRYDDMFKTVEKSQ